MGYSAEEMANDLTVCETSKQISIMTAFALSGGGRIGVTEEIVTPYGIAYQEASSAALSARAAIESGASVFRQGSFGIQETVGAQFWATENPLSVSNYAGRYGMSSSGGADWVMKANINSSFVTRAAPGFSSNIGGAIKAVTNPGGTRIQWFHMP